MTDADQSNLTSLTVDLLSAYVANNSVEHVSLAELIKSTHAALKIIESPEQPTPEEPEYKPAVSVRQSLKSDAAIISLIDGKPYQTLKRHLKGHGLTPDEYRTRYGLPKTYPMVAPAYSASRREIAKKRGLGNRVKGAQVEAVAPAVSKTAETVAPKPEASTAKVKKAATPKAPMAVTAKAEATPPAKAKEAPKPRAQAKAKTPAKAVPVADPKPVEAPTPAAPTKAAPKARKAAAPKQAAAPAVEAKAPAKPALRKRAAKAPEPTT